MLRLDVSTKATYGGLEHDHSATPSRDILNDNIYVTDSESESVSKSPPRATIMTPPTAAQTQRARRYPSAPVACLARGWSYAALASRVFEAPASILIERGRLASGTSRTRSMWSRPFTNCAPTTLMWSASWKRRSKARPAMPR